MKTKIACILAVVAIMTISAVVAYGNAPPLSYVNEPPYDDESPMMISVIQREGYFAFAGIGLLVELLLLISISTALTGRTGPGEAGG